jgi:nitroreductase
MDVQELLVGRCTVHDYEPRPLPAGALRRAFEAALAAPNHRLTEPWRFTVVGPVARERIIEIAIAIKAKGAPPRPELIETTRRKMGRSAELLVVSQVKHTDPETAREDYAAVACAIQNLCLSLWAEGVGSKWSTGGATTAAATYELLGLDSAIEEIVGFVWAGIPAQSATKAKRRLAVSDVVRSVP